MRRFARFGAAVLAAMLAVGCGSAENYPITSSGGGDPTQNEQIGTAPDGLTQFADVTGPSVSTGTGTGVSVTLSTWLQNNTQNPITVVVRACALQPGDLIASDSVQFIAPDQSACAADSVQTVTLPPFGTSQTYTDTYTLTGPDVQAGSFQLFVRIIQQEVAPPGPSYFMTVGVGSGN